MEYRTLDLTLISAKGIKKASLFGKQDVYAVAYISGVASNQKLRTPVDKDAGSNPTWNFPMKFTVDEAAGLHNRLTLTIEIMGVGMLGDTNVGRVLVPVKELLDGIKGDGKPMQFVNYQVRKSSSGKVKGEMNFSYAFGEKFTGKAEEVVTAFPAVGSSSMYSTAYPAAGYPPQVQGGYAYPPQQQPAYGGHAAPGYSGYPSQPGYGYPPVQQPPKKNKTGMGLGAGLLGGALGGLLIGGIVSDAASGGCGGGGCGGGGCGGGCGG